MGEWSFLWLHSWLVESLYGFQVANDVGFFNYKFFFLTLLYSGVTLIFVCYTMAATGTVSPYKLPWLQHIHALLVRASIDDSNISFEQVFFTFLGTALSFFMLA